MAELKAKTPCGDLLPRHRGDVTLEEVDPGVLTSVTVLGDEAALSDALEKAHGIPFPAANRATGKAGVRCIWFGRDQALLMGAVPDAGLGSHAVLVDQSDGWCAVSLSGGASEEVLARLVPVDLRSGVFKRGHTVRSLVGHMGASITRTGRDRFVILVFRSMAVTLVHELDKAMQGVAARR